MAAPMTVGSWPEADLEYLGHCPICACRKRTLLHLALTDETFGSAPGEWSLWRCLGCESAYLDPRPNAQSIGSAYERYYTHENGDPRPDASLLGRWRSLLGNGYRNKRYNLRLEPASRFGPILAALAPPLRWPADLSLRYLPAARPGSRILDVGCGSGGWLRSAQQAGWEVAGVEPDPKARGLARANGVDVRAQLPDFEGETFDAITLSHVIEHVHDPIAILSACRDRLKSTGMIYIDTPNIDAVGHHIYGRHWRGIEAPRHLVLFNRSSLRGALRLAGFGRIRFRPRFYPIRGIERQSQLMAAGLDPNSIASAPANSRRFGLFRSIQATLSVKRTEFLTVTAAPDPAL